MFKRNLLQPFGIDKISFKDRFTAPSLRHFSVLITGKRSVRTVHRLKDENKQCVIISP